MSTGTTDSIRNVIIVGSGPSGLAAANTSAGEDRSSEISLSGVFAVGDKIDPIHREAATVAGSASGDGHGDACFPVAAEEDGSMTLSSSTQLV